MWDPFPGMLAARPLPLVLASALCLTATGCSKLRDLIGSKDDAGAAAEDGASAGSGSATPVSSASATASASSSPTASAEATNEADVARHPGDKAIDHLAVVVKYAKGATASIDAGSGKTVANLKTGTAATAVAEYNGFKRVVFADPKDGTKKLTGWVQKYVFEDGLSGRPVPVCALNQVLVSDAMSPFEPRCTTRCKTGADCKGKYCYSAVFLAAEGGKDPPKDTTGFIDACGNDSDRAPAASASAKTPGVGSTACAAPSVAYSLDDGKTTKCGTKCTSDKDCGGGKCVTATVMWDSGPAISPSGRGLTVGICKK